MVTSDLAIDYQQGLSDAWAKVATFAPLLAMFLVILFVGWIVAKIVSKIVDAVLERVGFDRLVERGGIKQMLAQSQYDASSIIAKLAYYAIMLITLQVAFNVFGPNTVSDLLTRLVAWLPNVAIGILIVVIAAAIANAVREIITSALGGLSYGKLLGTIASVFILGAGIIAALNQIGIATAVTQPVLITVLATIGGILIVGVGGGLVRPMQQRWDGWLSNLEEELPQVRGHAQAYQRGREDASRHGAGPAMSEPPQQPQQFVQQGTGQHAAQPGQYPQQGYGQQPGGYPGGEYRQ